MNKTTRLLLAAVPALLLAQNAAAQQSMTYGRITAVRQVPVESQGARTTGTIVGGTIGVMSGKGKSSSNKALRGLGGAAVGGAVGGSSSRQMANEYTVLIDGTSTIRMLTDAAGMRVGDCVAVERGAFNNIRLVPEERCGKGAAQSAAEQAEAEACSKAKQQLLDAATDADFDRAERRMRALCN